jgi:hypothetical protein
MPGASCEPVHGALDAVQPPSRMVLGLALLDSAATCSCAAATRAAACAASASLTKPWRPTFWPSSCVSAACSSRLPVLLGLRAQLSAFATCVPSAARQ